MKLLHMWCSVAGEVICILEGNAVAGATVSMVVIASGAFSKVETVEMVTMKQQVEAMRTAGEVAGKVQAAWKVNPGRVPQGGHQVASSRAS